MLIEMPYAWKAKVRASGGRESERLVADVARFEVAEISEDSAPIVLRFNGFHASVLEQSGAITPMTETDGVVDVRHFEGALYEPLRIVAVDGDAYLVGRGAADRAAKAMADVDAFQKRLGSKESVFLNAATTRARFSNDWGQRNAREEVKEAAGLLLLIGDVFYRRIGLPVLALDRQRDRVTISPYYPAIHHDCDVFGLGEYARLQEQIAGMSGEAAETARYWAESCALRYAIVDGDRLEMGSEVRDDALRFCGRSLARALAADLHEFPLDLALAYADLRDACDTYVPTAEIGSVVELVANAVGLAGMAGGMQCRAADAARRQLDLFYARGGEAPERGGPSPAP